MSRTRGSERSHPTVQVVLVVALGLVLSLGFLWLEAPPTRESPTGAPDAPISRDQFRALIENLSEPEGYFDTDNFVSNETSYLHVVPALIRNVRAGGAYLGVGPDQNFSYIVHQAPSVAIIADIRRQNMLQHLLFKVLIEESRDRYEFLCRLFSRDCEPADRELEFGELLAKVRTALRDTRLFVRNLEQVQRVLLDDYRLTLDPEDLERIEYVYRSFLDRGLDIRFSTFGRPSGRYPTYEELLLERDVEGRYQNYLSDPRLFQRLQQFQRENRLIPIVGDLAGSHALAATAAFLRERGLDVTVFYVSNVEFYLFGGSGWRDYLANVDRFRFADDAVFIRSYFPTLGPIHPLNQSGHRPTSLIQPVAGFLDDAQSGQITRYWDIVSRHLISY